MLTYLFVGFFCGIVATLTALVAWLSLTSDPQWKIVTFECGDGTFKQAIVQGYAVCGARLIASQMGWKFKSVLDYPIGM